MPTGTSAEMVTLNLAMGAGLGVGCLGSGLGAGFFGSGLGAGGGGGMIDSALMPGWLNSSDCGSSRSVPEKVTSTVVPALAPQGVSVNNFGFGKLFPAGGCPNVVPAHAKNAPIRTESVGDRTGLENEEARRMGSSLGDHPRRENILTPEVLETSEVSTSGEAGRNQTKFRCVGSGYRAFG